MVVVISGTSSGLGLELAKRFIAAGNRVIGFSRSAGQILEGENYRHYALNIADRKNVMSAVRDCGVGDVDLLINNAGLSGSGRRILEVDPDEVQELLNVNLFGALNLVQAFLLPLKKAKGRIVNISSRFGSLSFNRETENRSLKISYSYRISKASQNMLAVCLANELEEEGIRVNTIHPGSFKSNCGRPEAEKLPEEVASLIYDWIHSGENSEELVLREVGGLEYKW